MPGEIAGPPDHDTRCPQREDRLIGCCVDQCGALLTWPWPTGVGPNSRTFGAIVCAEHATDEHCPQLGIAPVLVLPEAGICERCDDLAEGDHMPAALP